jgi:hypothetical protein
MHDELAGNGDAMGRTGSAYDSSAFPVSAVSELFIVDIAVSSDKAEAPQMATSYAPCYWNMRFRTYLQ